jgi:methionyl-tRNA formyltransferase
VTFVLFCNPRYGGEFERAFRAWCARRRAARFLVVRSLRGEFERGGSVRSRLRIALRRARIAAGDAASRWRGGSLVHVEDVNAPAFRDRLRRAPPPVFGVVAGFNQIFRPGTIGLFERLYNFHPSLLPYYRGPVPSYWCIRNGEERTGITLHEVGAEIDRGRILWQATLPITTTDPEDLDGRLSRLGADVLPALLDHLADGSAPPSAHVAADEVYRVKADYLSFPRPAGR